MNVAILGANGFVGSHLFASWQANDSFQPRAVVRRPASLARVARFADADWRLADACDFAALTKAFDGCDAVVHTVVGDERVIAATLDPVYRAAAAAGVRELVYLSSAAVHGLCPSSDTNENTPLRDDQPLTYNNAKVRAERRLRSLAKDDRVRVTIFRPGIVLGPRSRWVTDVADALTKSRAWWVDGGSGICNSIQVGNLVHAIECVLANSEGAGGTYLVGDLETITWRDLYLGLARALGHDASVFTEAIPYNCQTAYGRRDRIMAIKSIAPVQAVLQRLSPRLKESVNAALGRWYRPPKANPWALPKLPAPPQASLEMTMLFSCAHKLSHARATKILGYRPPVSFASGLQETVAWLETMGYPIQGAAVKD